MSRTASMASGVARVKALLLKRAPEPMRAVDIARICDLPIAQTRNRLSELIQAGVVSNVGTPRAAIYTIAGARKPVVVRETPPCWNERGLLVYKPMQPARDGAEDFLLPGSLQNGQLVERTRPVLIGAMPADKFAAMRPV